MIVAAIGCPGSGKTTELLRRARSRAEVRGVGLLALDPARTKALAELPHFTEAEAFIRAARGQHVAVETDRAENLFRAVLRRGNFVILLDESRWYASAFSIPQSLRRVLRIHRAIGVDVFFSTQHIADAAQEVWAVTDTLLVFRTLSPRARQYLRAEFGVEQNTLELARGEFLEINLGMA